MKPFATASTTFWRGKPISDCTKEELIDAVMWLGKKYEEFHDPKAVRARALGQIEMMKRGEPA